MRSFATLLTAVMSIVHFAWAKRLSGNANLSMLNDSGAKHDTGRANGDGKGKFAPGVYRHTTEYSLDVITIKADGTARSKYLDSDAANLDRDGTWVLGDDGKLHVKWEWSIKEAVYAVEPDGLAYTHPDDPDGVTSRYTFDGSQGEQ